jgi:transposase InsO family protein
MAIAVVEQAAATHRIQAGELTLESDNGSAFTARRFKAKLAELGIRHRRRGYRDPESQALIESWFGKLKERRGVAERVRDDRRRPPPDRRLPRPLTTTDRTRASTTARRSRCARPGRICKDYKKPRPRLSTPAGTRS